MSIFSTLEISGAALGAERQRAEVVAAKPLADLDKTWADNDQAAANFAKQVYNSFKRS